MSFETDFDSAFTILLGKATGVLTQTGVPTPTNTTGSPSDVATSRVVDVALLLGSSGSPLATTDAAFLRLGLGGTATVVSWSLAGLVSAVSTAGSVTLDVGFGSSISSINSMTGTGPPRLSSQFERTDVTPTGWTTLLIPDQRWLYVRPSTVDGVLQMVGLTLRVAVA